MIRKFVNCKTKLFFSVGVQTALAICSAPQFRLRRPSSLHTWIIKAIVHDLSLKFIFNTLGLVAFGWQLFPCFVSFQSTSKTGMSIAMLKWASTTYLVQMWVVGTVIISFWHSAQFSSPPSKVMLLKDMKCCTPPVKIKYSSKSKEQNKQ